MSERGRILPKLLPALLLLLGAALFLFARVILAAHLPDVEITSPSAGESVSGTVSVVVSYSVDNGHVHDLTLSAAGQTVSHVDVHQRTGTYTFNLNTTDYPDGALSLSVEACSADQHSGHCSTDSVNVVVDNAPDGPEAPWIEFTSPESGETLSGTVVVSASFEYVNAYTRTIHLYANGVEADSEVISVKVGSVTFSLDTAEYPDGALQLMVSECPPEGGSEWCRQDTVNVTVDNVEEDTEAPEIAIGAPDAGELLGAAPVLVSATLSDNVAVDPATVVVKLDGSAVTSQCTVTAVSISCSLSPADGTHSVTIDCKDTSNNPAVRKSVLFKLDTAAPSVSVTSHTSGQVVVTQIVNLAGAVSDATSNVASVKVNGEDASLNGNSWSLSGFALDEGANAIVVAAEDAAGHTALANITINYVVPECFADAGCNDGDAHTQDVCMNPGAAAAACVHNDIECLNDSECDDSDAYTLDTCTGAGTPQSSCAHAAIACLSAADCDDADAHTADACSAPGTTHSVCSHSSIECLSNAECDDSAPLTLDTCNSPGTAASSCSHDPITCAAATDCDDSNALTLDACVRPGTAQSDCTHTAIACNTNADCDDDNAHTQDACANGGTAAAECAHNNIECLSAADCDDGNAYTEDSCAGAGTVSSACAHSPISCNSPADCDDANALTLDSCVNPGTAAASCSHATFACNTNADCDDGNDHTRDICSDGGTPQSACSHNPILCLNDSDCDDADDHTQDVCSNGGTPAAACAHNNIACLSDAECNDGNALTLDACANPGTTNSNCTHTAIACNNAADCDDGNALSLDACANGGTASAACSHTAFACNTDADCDDENNSTEDICSDGGTLQSACRHNSISCQSNSDCDDENPLTLDRCNNAGTVLSACAHTAIACNSAADCDDGNALTLDTCANPGAAAASCAHTAFACNTDADCATNNPLATVTCLNPGTAEASCLQVLCPVACTAAADCNDANALTTDACNAPNTCNAECAHTACPVACASDADCNDNNEQTTDTCNNAGACAAVCAHAAVPAPLTLSVSAPDDGALINKDNVYIEGQTTASATLNINGQNITVAAAGAFAATASLAEGANELIIVASRGDESITKTIHITVDTQKPYLLSSMPSTNSELDTAPERISIRIADTAGGSGLNKDAVRLSLDGEELVAQYVEGGDSFEVAAGELAPGTHVILAIAPDIAGNTLEQAVSFSIAGKGPEIKIVRLPGQIPDGTAAAAEQPAAASSITSATTVADTQPASTAPETTTSPATAAQTDSSTTGLHLGWPFYPKYDPTGLKKMLDEQRAKTTQLPQWLSDFLTRGEGATSGGANENAQAPTQSLNPPQASAMTIPDMNITLDGEIEAVVTENQTPILTESIKVIVDGERIQHEYDADNRKIKCKVKKLKQGSHEVTVTASDTNTLQGVVSTAFAVDPTINSITLETPDRSDGMIGAGDRFRITVTMQETGFTGAWAVLYNPATDVVVPGSVASGTIGNWVGNVYNLTESPSGSGNYVTEGWFYTSSDRGGREASLVFGAAPLDDPPVSYVFSGSSLQVAGQVITSLDSLTLANSSDPSSRTINTGDSFNLSGTGMSGIQAVDYWLVNPEASLEGADFADMILQSGEVAETPPGSGQYSLPTSGVLSNLVSQWDTINGTSAHILLALAQSRYSGGNTSPAFSNILYVGPQPVPEITSVEIRSMGELQVGQSFDVLITGNIDPVHEPYMRLRMYNPSRLPANWTPLMGNGAFIIGTEVKLGNGIRKNTDGTYTATVTIPQAIDANGQPVTVTAAMVTTAAFFDYAVSPTNSLIGEPIQFSDITFRNTDHPDQMTIAPGEHFKVTFKTNTPPAGFICRIYGGPEKVNIRRILLTELIPYYNEQTYTCNGVVPDPLPEIASGVPVETIEVMVSTYNETYYDYPFEWLTVRLNIQAVHIYNHEQKSSDTVHNGEHIEIQVLTTSPLQADLSGLLLVPDTIKGPNPIFYQIPDGTFTLIGQSGGIYEYSGQVEITENMFPYPETNEIRALIQSPGYNFYVFSTDILKYIPIKPVITTITSIDGASAATGEVTSGNVTPAVAGTAPSDKTVRIYELIPIGGDDVLVPVSDAPDLFATFDSAQNTYNVSGPSMQFDGRAYDVSGTNGFILDNITGAKDVYVFLATLYDFKETPNQSVSYITVYSAGDPNTSEADQYNYTKTFIDAAKAGGVFSDYKIDAYGVALKASPLGAGNDYTPVSQISAQVEVCVVKQQPGYLKWDAAQNKYLASYTPIQKDGVTYSDAIVWGFEEDGSPLFVTAPDTPVSCVKPRVKLTPDGVEN